MCGEGVYLKCFDGICFMKDFDECEEFVFCDIVVCVIDFEMKCFGVNCVYFDISYKDKDFIIEYFFIIYVKCLSVGLDIIKEVILVVLVVYYICGGVMIDFNGCIDLDNFYVVGEVVYIGLYGVNCMVSNLLFECIVFVYVVVKDILSKIDVSLVFEVFLLWDESCVINLDEEIVIIYNWYELRLFMWDYVGIVCLIKCLECVFYCVELL